jgi:hypothetical protein
MLYCARVAALDTRTSALGLGSLLVFLVVLVMGMVVVSCGSETPPPLDPAAAGLQGKPGGTSVEVSELDVGENGIDRFLHCPPPGELGQDWIPPIPSWTPAAGAELLDAGPLPPELETMHGSTPTDRAIADTRETFRACYNHGLVYDPTQDGHVAIVLRVGADGRVARVESWGACEIVSQTIECMRDAAKKLRFRPPVSGSDTVTIPAVFTSSAAVRQTSPRSSDVYTASTYIAVEKLRPALHACEQSAHQAGRGVIASATFNLEVDKSGKVLSSHVDPWSGDKDLLACAASALGNISLPPPPGTKASVIVRIAFNPRAGTK